MLKIYCSYIVCRYALIIIFLPFDSCDNYASFNNNCVTIFFKFCVLYIMIMVHLKHLQLVNVLGSYTLSNGNVFVPVCELQLRGLCL